VAGASLDDIRAHARRELERLPMELRAIQPLLLYLVEISASLQQLAAVADRRMGLGELRS